MIVTFLISNFKLFLTYIFAIYPVRNFKIFKKGLKINGIMPT